MAFGSVMSFLDKISKPRPLKEKIDKLDFIKI